VPSEKIRKMMVQLLIGLKYMHDKGIYHLDLRPESISIDNRNNLILGDFACKEEFIPERKEVYGTCGYIAPEYLMKETKIVELMKDMWAVGAIFYHLITDSSLVDGGESTLDALEDIMSRLGTPTQKEKYEWY
jgi:serine/threonine protein kinase